MKYEDFKVGKEYRRILANKFSTPIGTIYKCTAKNKNYLTFTNMLDKGYFTMDDNDSSSVYSPQAFEPVEPVDEVKEEFKTGDLILVEATCGGYIYLGKTTEGNIITLNDVVSVGDYNPDKYTSIKHKNDIFIWGGDINYFKKYTKPIEPIKPTEVELTLKQIADKFNINIEQLRIKGDLND